MSGKKKKIYFVLGSFKGGGTERTASRIGMELINQGYNVKFLLLNGVFDYNDERLRKNSVVLKNFGIKNKHLKMCAAFFSLFFLVWRERPTRLISFSIGINLLIFFIFYPGTVFRIESNMFIYRKRKYKRYLQKYFSVFPHVKYVVVPSAGLAEACRNYLLRPEKVKQINNPIDLQEIASKAEEPLDRSRPELSRKFIISAGRLSMSKGYDQLIKLYRKSSLYPDTNLIILGKGERQSVLEDLIKTLNLHDHVFLAGHVANPFKYFRHAEFFILNSSHESFGNVLIEALGSGTLVLSNDCNYGPRDILRDRETGFLYNRTDEKSFLQLLDNVLTMRQTNAVRQNGIRSAQLFAIDKITNQWKNEIIGK